VIELYVGGLLVIPETAIFKLNLNQNERKKEKNYEKDK